MLGGSTKTVFTSCTGLAELVAGLRDRGLVDLSTLGRSDRPVDPFEGIIYCSDEGRDRV